MERLLSAGGDEMPRDFLFMRDETQEITLLIIDGGEQVGRVYEATGSAGTKWFWAIGNLRV